MARYIVFGIGSIGGAVAHALLDEGHEVVAVHKGASPGRGKPFERRGAKILELEIEGFYLIKDASVFFGKEPFDGVVYAVGNCPPSGINAETEFPMSAIRMEKLRQEMERHVYGLHGAVTCLLRSGSLADEARIVVVGSAITRFIEDHAKLPPPVNPFHYAAAKAAQDGIVAGFQHEFAAAGDKRTIDIVKPSAVDTPFHEGAEFPPPSMEPLPPLIENIVSRLTK